MPKQKAWAFVIFTAKKIRTLYQSPIVPIAWIAMILTTLLLNISLPEKNISDVQYDASALTNKNNTIDHSPLHVNINDATQYEASFFLPL